MLACDSKAALIISVCLYLACVKSSPLVSEESHEELYLKAAEKLRLQIVDKERDKDKYFWTHSLKEENLKPEKIVRVLDEINNRLNIAISIKEIPNLRRGGWVDITNNKVILYHLSLSWICKLAEKKSWYKSQSNGETIFQKAYGKNGVLEKLLRIRSLHGNEKSNFSLYQLRFLRGLNAPIPGKKVKLHFPLIPSNKKHLNFINIWTSGGETSFVSVPNEEDKFCKSTYGSMSLWSLIYTWTDIVDLYSTDDYKAKDPCFEEMVTALSMIESNLISGTDKDAIKLVKRLRLYYQSVKSFSDEARFYRIITALTSVFQRSRIAGEAYASIENQLKAISEDLDRKAFENLRFAALGAESYRLRDAEILYSYMLFMAFVHMPAPGPWKNTISFLDRTVNGMPGDEKRKFEDLIGDELKVLSKRRGVRWGSEPGGERYSSLLLTSLRSSLELYKTQNTLENSTIKIKEASLVVLPRLRDVQQEWVHVEKFWGENKLSNERFNTNKLQDLFKSEQDRWDKEKSKNMLLSILGQRTFSGSLSASQSARSLLDFILVRDHIKNLAFTLEKDQGDQLNEVPWSGLSSKMLPPYPPGYYYQELKRAQKVLKEHSNTIADYINEYQKSLNTNQIIGAASLSLDITEEEVNLANLALEIAKITEQIAKRNSEIREKYCKKARLANRIAVLSKSAKKFEELSAEKRLNIARCEVTRHRLSLKVLEEITSEKEGSFYNQLNELHKQLDTFKDKIEKVAGDLKKREAAPRKKRSGFLKAVQGVLAVASVVVNIYTGGAASPLTAALNAAMMGASLADKISTADFSNLGSSLNSISNLLPVAQGVAIAWVSYSSNDLKDINKNLTTVNNTFESLSKAVDSGSAILDFGDPLLDKIKGGDFIEIVRHIESNLDVRVKDGQLQVDLSGKMRLLTHNLSDQNLKNLSDIEKSYLSVVSGIEEELTELFDKGVKLANKANDARLNFEGKVDTSLSRIHGWTQSKIDTHKRNVESVYRQIEKDLNNFVPNKLKLMTLEVYQRSGEEGLDILNNLKGTLKKIEGKIDAKGKKNLDQFLLTLKEGEQEIKVLPKTIASKVFEKIVDKNKLQDRCLVVVDGVSSYGRKIQKFRDTWKSIGEQIKLDPPKNTILKVDPSAFVRRYIHKLRNNYIRPIQEKIVSIQSAANQIEKSGDAIAVVGKIENATEEIGNRIKGLKNELEEMQNQLEESKISEEVAHIDLGVARVLVEIARLKIEDSQIQSAIDDLELINADRVTEIAKIKNKINEDYKNYVTQYQRKAAELEFLAAVGEANRIGIAINGMRFPSLLDSFLFGNIKSFDRSNDDLRNLFSYWFKVRDEAIGLTLWYRKVLSMLKEARSTNLFDGFITKADARLKSLDQLSLPSYLADVSFNKISEKVDKLTELSDEAKIDWEEFNGNKYGNIFNVHTARPEILSIELNKEDPKEIKSKLTLGQLFPWVKKGEMGSVRYWPTEDGFLDLKIKVIEGTKMSFNGKTVEWNLVPESNKGITILRDVKIFRRGLKGASLSFPKWTCSFMRVDGSQYSTSPRHVITYLQHDLSVMDNIKAWLGFEVDTKDGFQDVVLKKDLEFNFKIEEINPDFKIGDFEVVFYLLRF